MAITLPTLPYAVLQARSVPCLEIGGDFYDAVALDDCVCVAIADVSGKGVPAAIVAATLQGILHAQAMTGQGLAEIASLVNRFLCSRNVGKYATMVLLKLFPDGFVEYVNCGHVPPVVVSDTTVRRLEESNLIVGLIPEATYTAAQCRLNPGERILLATDGITEAENANGDEFGNEGLQTIALMTDLSTMIARLANFQATIEAQDDWTLVDIRYAGNNLHSSL
jgi:serine phosphatase RsbU (regulator of sigma subunit)